MVVAEPGCSIRYVSSGKRASETTFSLAEWRWSRSGGGGKDTPFKTWQTTSYCPVGREFDQNFQPDDGLWFVNALNYGSSFVRGVNRFAQSRNILLCKHSDSSVITGVFHVRVPRYTQYLIPTAANICVHQYENAEFLYNCTIVCMYAYVHMYRGRYRCERKRTVYCISECWKGESDGKRIIEVPYIMWKYTYIIYIYVYVQYYVHACEAASVPPVHINNYFSWVRMYYDSFVSSFCIVWFWCVIKSKVA